MVEERIPHKENEKAENIPNIQNSVCSKCKCEPSYIHIRSLNLCKSCFLSENLHRFKSTIRTKLRMWKTDYILVCVSGSPNSMCLLHLLYKTLEQNNAKRVFLNIFILYIEEGGGEKTKGLVVKACLQYGFKLMVIPLSEVYNIDQFTIPEKISPTIIGIPSIKLRKNKEERKEEERKIEEKELAAATPEDRVESPINFQRLSNFIEYFPSRGSFKKRMIESLRRFLILDIAKKHGFNKVLFGNNSLTICANALAQMAEGRGIQVAYDADYANASYSLLFAFPLRDFLPQEILAYIHLNQLDFGDYNRKAMYLATYQGLPAQGNLEESVKEFLLNLHDTNALHSILRSIPKLIKQESDFLIHPFCPVCHGVRDKQYNPLESTSMKWGKGVKEKEENGKLLDILCYGCKLMMQSTSESEVLDFMPIFMKNNIIAFGSK